MLLTVLQHSVEVAASVIASDVIRKWKFGQWVSSQGGGEVTSSLMPSLSVLY